MLSMQMKNEHGDDEKMMDTREATFSIQKFELSPNEARKFILAMFSISENQIGKSWENGW